MKIDNIHRLAVPADRQPVGQRLHTGKSQPQRGRVNAGWWNGRRHNMAGSVWSVMEIHSLSFSLFFSLIHNYIHATMCLTVGRRWRDLRPLSRDRLVTFYKQFSYCFKRRKNVVWQSADGRVTSDHCRVTVQWLLSKFYPIAWNV